VGRPVACGIVHADGTTESLLLNHSYSEARLAWFRAGAALNLVAGAQAREQA
jgi:aconitate hydratase